MKLRLLALAAMFLVSTALAQTSPNYNLSWHVMGAGGSEGLAAGARQAYGTLGQFAVGSGQSAAYGVCAGYWCGVELGSALYLPLIYKVAEP